MTVQLKRISLWRRLAAAFYDLLLLLALYFLVGWIAVMSNDGEAVDGRLLFWPLLLIAWGFFAKFWCHPGQTLGMQVWKFRIVNKYGTALTFRQASARFLLSLISWACVGLGFIWVLIDRDGLAWHDRLSHTRLEFIDHQAKSESKGR
ncbi:RDD family protein [Marinomonas piezotolerans]|nr:RDD family protein [Marinomonas piezotolerans]